MSQAAVYDQFNHLLKPGPSSGRHRTPSDIHDGLKKIRRLVLTEGIPEEVSPGSLIAIDRS